MTPRSWILILGNIQSCSNACSTLNVLEDALDNKMFKLHKCKCSILSSSLTHSLTQDCLYFDVWDIHFV